MFGASGLGDRSGFGGLVVRPRVLASSPKPYGGYYDDVTDALEQAYPGFSDAILAVVVDRGELTLHVRPQRIVEVCQRLRDESALRFELLSNLSGVDYLGQPDRLQDRKSVV